MMKPHTALLPLLAVAITAYARPITYVDYGQDKIPNIVTAAGIASEIIFEPDEIIEYHTFGFEAAWEAQVVKDHILVFKSKDAQPQTNLIVHTDKRSYLFTVTVGNNNWEGHPNKAGAIYSMRMRYHDAKAMQNKQARDDKKVLRNREIATSDTYLYTNYDYRATANAYDIVPTRVWDNGKITFMTFHQGTKRGVAYELDSEHKANLVNQHTEKNGVLVVHGVYNHLILRLGDQAVEIRRNDRSGRAENDSKTTVKGTVRTVDENAPSIFRRPPQATNATDTQQRQIEQLMEVYNNAQSNDENESAGE